MCGGAAVGFVRVRQVLGPTKLDCWTRMRPVIESADPPHAGQAYDGGGEWEKEGEGKGAPARRL